MSEPNNGQPPASRELSAKNEENLSAQVLGFRLTIACLDTSISSYDHQPTNKVFQSSVQQQYQCALGHLDDLLNMPLVVHSDEYVKYAQATIDAFRTTCQRREAGTLFSFAQNFQHIFQRAADYHFAQDRVGREGKPCQTYESLLAQQATIPLFEERRNPEPPTPGVPYTITFQYGGPEIPDRRKDPHEQVLDRRCIGDMYLAVVQHVQGHTRA